MLGLRNPTTKTEAHVAVQLNDKISLASVWNIRERTLVLKFWVLYIDNSTGR